MAGESAIVGRAKAVLVFGQGADARAVVAEVLARVRQPAGQQRLIFTGPVTFEPHIMKHLGDDVLEAVDRITRRLLPGHRRQTFELSIVNLAVASTIDVGVSISGFSAAATVFSALLSAVAKIPVPQDIAMTGHMASADGDIRPVSSIPEKVAGAARDPAVHKLIVPSLDADTSLRVLSPAERERAADAITNAKGELRVAQVTDVAHLVQELFDEEAVVLGSLRRGFFEPGDVADESNGPIGRTVCFLTEGNEKRFWRVLEAQLFASNAAGAQELLLTRVRYQLRRRQYPQDLGRRLFQLVRSLPPSIRRTAGLFPLMPKDVCLKVCKLAEQDDYEDVGYLRKAAFGKITEPVQTSEPPPQPIPSAPHRDVDAVLAEISSESLARTIGISIDSARSGFLMDTVVLDSDELFLEMVAAFYLTLVRHTGSEHASLDDRTIRSESLALLERAFTGKGGADAARAEARHGIHGGMRFVLDVMTERYKHELQINHVKRIVAEAVDPLEWNDRVAFMRAFLQRLGPQLPPEIRNEPAERYARHYGTILESYVRSFDQMKQLLRTL
jgi:hypothetical protein